MATTVNTTVERIELTGLDKGAKGVIDSVRGSVGSLRAGVDTLNNALAAVGVTLGLGAMIAFARDTLAATAALDDMAESTGASVEGLSAIRRVAQVGGHDFDGLTGQIAKTVKGLREGSDEGGRAAKAFEFLGVRTRDSSGRLRDMGEVLVEFAQKLDKYEDGGEKVLLVQEALGRGAERYIPLLKDMAEGTDLVATTTAKQAEEADKAEKAMQRLGVVFEDSRRTLVNEYAPAFTRLIEQMSEGIRIAGGFGAAILKLGTMSPFQSAGENIAEQRAVIEQLTAGRELLAGMPGYEGAVAQLDRDLLAARQRKQFAEFLQRQEALAGAGEENLDVRDRMARGRRSALDFRPEAEGADAKILREAEFRAQKQVELEEMAAADSREAWEFYTKGRLAHEAELRKGQEQMMRDWFALIDKKQAEAIERGEEYLASQENRIQEFYNNQLHQLVAARERGLLTEEEFNERRIELEIQHQERLTGVSNTAYQQRQRFIKSSMLAQAQTIFGELANITAGVAQHNKTLFQINKVASIANAVINTYQGVTKSLATYPMPWAAVMAAVHLAAGLAQVSAIQQTQFGGTTAPSVAGTAPAAPVTPVAQTAPSQAQRGPDTFINIQGDDIFTGRTVARLAERLTEFQRDGGRVVVVTS